MDPLMFNRANIWRLCWLVQKSDVVIFHPLFGLFGGMLGILILLKNHLLLRNPTLLQARQHVVFQNGHILVSVRATLNCYLWTCTKAVPKIQVKASWAHT